MGKKKQKKIEHGGSLIPDHLMKSVLEEWAKPSPLAALSAAGSKTFTVPSAFKYGDIVRHQDCPEQREMVISVSGTTVTTIVLDTTDGFHGQSSAYAAHMLERVE